MCNDPQHNPTPVLDAVRAKPGIATSELHDILYAEYGITNQVTRIGVAIEQRLITRKRQGKYTRHYLREGA